MMKDRYDVKGFGDHEDDLAVLGEILRENPSIDLVEAVQMVVFKRKEGERGFLN